MVGAEIPNSAKDLIEAIGLLATDYKSGDFDNHPVTTLEKWQYATLCIAEFLHANIGTLNESSIFIEDLIHLLADLRKGQPTSIDKIKRKTGQSVTSRQEMDFVRCCFAITCLMKAKYTKTDAAKRVASEMQKLGIKGPSQRRVKTQDGSIANWQAIDNWRDKLITAQRSKLALKYYNSLLTLIDSMRPDQLENHAIQSLNVRGLRSKNL